MTKNKAVVAVCAVLMLGLGGCSRQQSDWEKTRAANTTDSYEQFLKKYPNGEFAAQAQARVKELYEEHDWQQARDTDTQEAYQGFLKQHPEGKWTEEARIRVENFTLAQAPSSAATAGAEAAGRSGSPASGDAAAGSASPSGPDSAAPPVIPPKPTAATRPAAPRLAAAPAKSSKSPSGPGSYGIQLGAFKSSAAAATQRWAHLEKEYPNLLAALSPTVSPKKTAAGTLYRLQTSGLTEKRARAICKTLKSKSQACVILRPAHV